VGFCLFSSKALIFYKKQIVLEQLIKASKKKSHRSFFVFSSDKNEADAGFCWIFFLG